MMVRLAILHVAGIENPGFEIEIKETMMSVGKMINREAVMMRGAVEKKICRRRRSWTQLGS